MKKYQTYEFEIKDINHAGKGLAILDDVETLIGPALPGQKVEAWVFKKKREKAEARLISVLKHRPDEIAPTCPHFGQPPTEEGRGCGGCQWQQLPYASQLHLKQEMVSRLLQPLIPDTVINSILPSPQEYGYRNKVELSFGDKTYLSEERYRALRDAKEPLPKGFYLGFHVPGSFGTIVDLHICHLISPTARQVFQALKPVFQELGGEAYSPRFHTGFWRHLILREGFRTGELMVHINTTDEFNPDWQPVLDALQTLNLPEGKRIRSVLHSVHSGSAQIVGWNAPRVLWGDDLIEEELCGLRFEISPYAFFQTNTAAAEQLYGEISRMANLETKPVVYDLYSGTGTIGMVLAQKGAAKVYGLEEIETAVADAKRNALRNQVENCSFETGKVEKLLEQLMESDPPQLVVVDPPRAGLHPKVVKLLNQLPLPQLIYVSCNPSALAKDLEGLQETYRVLEVQPVDLFPQTGHVETVVKLEARV